MLKYLVIQLADSSVSFCHYPGGKSGGCVMPVETLKDAIFWAMKENLALQFLYPDYVLPDEYKSVIAETYHTDIVSSACEDTELRAEADVVVFDSLAAINFFKFAKTQSYVFRATLNDLLESGVMLDVVLPYVDRLNIVITDISSFAKKDEKRYKTFLEHLAHKIAEEYRSGHGVQVNLLTDRILLDSMNNCNAGVETISICPDGRFYVCPAFYGDEGNSVGNLKDGLVVKNQQLYRLDHAPICRICDAYHCRRCVWLNRGTTHEVNTPGHEQCAASHIERNASRMLLDEIREIGQFMPGKEIPELSYLDPFDKLIKN